MMAPLLLVAITHQISMAVMNSGAVLGSVWIVWNTLKQGGKPWKLLLQHPDARSYLKATAFLGLSIFLSLWIAEWDPLSFGGSHAEGRWWLGVFPVGLLKLWYFALPLVWFLGLRELKPADRLKLLNVWLFAWSLLSCFGILQHWTAWFHFQEIPGQPGRHHVTAFLGHHLSLASVWLFSFFAALGLATDSKNLNRRWYALAAMLGGVALFYSYARSVWVALPIGLLVWSSRFLRPRVFAAVCFAALGLGFLALQVPEINHRLISRFGMSTREDLWLANWEFFRARPWTGVGFRLNEALSGMFLIAKTGNPDVFAGHAHNNFLEMLGGTGCIGAGAWLIWNGWAFRLFWKRRGHPMIWGFFCAFVVFHLNGLTQVNFWEGKVLHSLMWALGWGFAMPVTDGKRLRSQT